MSASYVYTHFDPTSLFAGDFPAVSQRVVLPQGLNSSGSPLEPGVLLGLRPAAPTYSASAAAKSGNTGNGTIAMGSPQTLTNVMVGVYRAVFTSATAYQVYDPLGDEIGVGANGTAFVTQVKFTTTAGGTAFVSGDEFDITVTQAAGALYSVSSAPTAGNVGTGTLALGSPAYTADVCPGTYVVTVMTPWLTPADDGEQVFPYGLATFVVTGPDGAPVGQGRAGSGGAVVVAAVPFAIQVAFTLVEDDVAGSGHNLFQPGDSFTITVTPNFGFVPCVRTAADGSQVPIAVLAEFVDTSGGPATANAYLTGEFAYEEMTIDSSWPSAEDLQAAIGNSGRTSLFIRQIGVSP